MSGWIVVTVQVIGSLDDYSWSYSWDGRYYPTRGRAIRAGIGWLDHDDFNVGRVENGCLVWWGWKDEEHPAEDRDMAAAALDFGAAS